MPRQLCSAWCQCTHLEFPSPSWQISGSLWVPERQAFWNPLHGCTCECWWHILWSISCWWQNSLSSSHHPFCRSHYTGPKLDSLHIFLIYCYKSPLLFSKDQQCNFISNFKLFMNHFILSAYWVPNTWWVCDIFLMSQCLWMSRVLFCPVLMMSNCCFPVFTSGWIKEWTTSSLKKENLPNLSLYCWNLAQSSLLN